MSPKKASASLEDSCNSITGPSSLGKKIDDFPKPSPPALDDPYLDDELFDETERPFELKVERDEYEIIMKREGYNRLFGPCRPI